MSRYTSRGGLSEFPARNNACRKTREEIRETSVVELNVENLDGTHPCTVLRPAYHLCYARSQLYENIMLVYRPIFIPPEIHKPLLYRQSNREPSKDTPASTSPPHTPPAHPLPPHPSH